MQCQWILMMSSSRQRERSSVDWTLKKQWIRILPWKSRLSNWRRLPEHLINNCARGSRSLCIGSKDSLVQNSLRQVRNCYSYCSNPGGCSNRQCWSSRELWACWDSVTRMTKKMGTAATARQQGSQMMKSMVKEIPSWPLEFWLPTDSQWVRSRSRGSPQTP